MNIRQTIEQTGFLIVEPKDGTTEEFLYLQKLLRAGKYFTSLNTPDKQAAFLEDLQIYRYYCFKFYDSTSYLTRSGGSDAIWSTDDVISAYTTPWLSEL